MDIITIILIVVSCTILGLGFAVVSKSRDKLNRFYFLNIITIIGWAVPRWMRSTSLR
jgi:ABC-type sugar transport system permease subunit